MKTYEVRKVVTYEYTAYIEAKDLDEAEDKARYDDTVEWEDVTDEGYNEDYDLDVFFDDDDDEDEDSVSWREIRRRRQVICYERI